MNGLVTLRAPIVARPATDPDDPDPETAFELATRAGWDAATAAAFYAWLIGLPATYEATGPTPWSIREARHLRFLATEYDAGSFAGDRDDA